MDPDANLIDQQYYADRVIALAEAGDPHDLAIVAVMLAERVKALDEWLLKGGFLPTRWIESTKR